MNNPDLGNPKSTLIDGLGNIIPGYIDMNGTDDICCAECPAP
jgi:hypothetical protein